MKRRKKYREAPESAGLPPLTEETAAALKAQVERVALALEAEADPETLNSLVQPQPHDPWWDLHLMAALGVLAHPAIPPLLAARFGAAPDKSRRKFLKRTLHLMQTRGVPVAPDLLPREAPRPLVAEREAPQAYVSQVLGNGSRFVILEGPREYLGGNILVAQLIDRQKFVQCHLLDIKSKEKARFWENLRGEDGMVDPLTVPAAYAVSLLEDAYKLNPGEGGASRYASLRERIRAHWGKPEDAPPRPAIPEVTPGERSRLLDESRRLALDPLFHSWLPGREEIAPWLEKALAALDSPLVLSEPQKQARAEGVKDEATRMLYPPDTLDLWSRRLLDMAYYLELKGRGEDALAVWAVAEDLSQTGQKRGPLTGENPFLKELVSFALRMAWEVQEQAKKPESASGLVAPADSSSLLWRG